MNGSPKESKKDYTPLADISRKAKQPWTADSSNYTAGLVCHRKIVEALQPMPKFDHGRRAKKAQSDS